MKKMLACILTGLMFLTVFSGCGSDTKQASAEETKKEDVQVEKKDVNKQESKEEKTAVKTPKKGILVVSFGTSYADTRKITIEASEEKIKNAFSDYETRRAFTSNIIRKKLKKRDNILVDSPEEALQKMKEEGFTEVIVEPLHIIPGIEYDEIKEVVSKFETDNSFEKLVLGRPVLYRTHDYELAIETLKNQLPKLGEGQAVVFMGHGTPHPANSSYALLQYLLEEKGMNNVYVGTVEGCPELDNVIRRLKKDGIKEVTLMPFMVVAGDHANNDMAGDEEDSWKTILKKEGFKVNTYIHGLGENEGIQDIYVQHVKDCIDGNPLMEVEE